MADLREVLKVNRRRRYTPIRDTLKGHSAVKTNQGAATPTTTTPQAKETLAPGPGETGGKQETSGSGGSEREELLERVAGNIQDRPALDGRSKSEPICASKPVSAAGSGAGARRGSVSQQRTAREGELGSRRVLDSTKRPWRIRDRGLLYNGMLRIETDDQRYPLPVAMASESMADYLVKLHNEMLTKK